MDRHATEQLVQFCIAQQKNFSPHDWYARFETDGAAVAFVAKYLSMTSWYGHSEELEKITAATCASAENSTGLHRESRIIDFDLPSFSVKLRAGLAVTDQLRPPARRERRHQQGAAAVAADQADASWTWKLFGD